MAGIEALLVLAMAALDFAIMARGIRTNELMPNAQLGSCLLKQCWQITFAAGEAISKLGAVVRLDAFGWVICSYGLGLYVFFGFSAGNRSIFRMTRNRLSGQRV